MVGIFSKLPDIAKAASITGGANLLGSAGTAVASAKQAKAQMDFQERMSNTAYQRAAKDLEAAGLNRILALGSPASTPGGAMGQVPDFGQALASGMNAASTMAGTASQAAVQEQQSLKLIQETIGVSAENAEKIVRSELWQAIFPAVQAAAGDIEKFAAYLMKPETMAEIATAMRNAPGQIISQIQEFGSKAIKGLPDAWLKAIQYTPIMQGYNYIKGKAQEGRFK